MRLTLRWKLGDIMTQVTFPERPDLKSVTYTAQPFLLRRYSAIHSCTFFVLLCREGKKYISVNVLYKFLLHSFNFWRLFAVILCGEQSFRLRSERQPPIIWTDAKFETPCALIARVTSKKDPLDVLLTLKFGNGSMCSSAQIRHTLHFEVIL